MPAYQATIQIGVVGGALVKQVTTDVQNLARGLDSLNAKLTQQTARIQSLGKTIRGSLSSAAIGGAFPLLFGQTPQAAVGGAIGGLLGGQAGGFAGSLLGTAIGELQATKTKVQELSTELGFSATQAQTLSSAFEAAGRNSQQLEAAVTNIRGLGLSVNETASAIKIAVELASEYGGSVEKIAQAFADTLESGKVSISTLNKFTSQGIPIQDQLAQKLGVSRTKLLEMAKDGKISVQQVTDALVTMGQQAEKTANKGSTGFDRFSAAVKNIALAIGDAAGALIKNLVPALDIILTKLSNIISQATKAINLITDKTVGELGTALALSGFARGTGFASKGNIDSITKALGSLRPKIATNTTELEKISAAAALAERELGRYGGQLGKLSEKTAQVELTRVQREIAQRRAELGKPSAPLGITSITAPAGLPAAEKAAKTAGENALQNSIKRTEVLKTEAATLFLAATIQDKINDADRVGATQLALRLTYERDRAKILGEYAAQQQKLANTANKAEESRALNQKRNAELVALQLDYENSIKTSNTERLAAGYELQTQLQNEAYLMQATLAGKAKEAELELQIANTIKDIKDPAQAAALAEQLRQNAALKEQLDLANQMKQVYGQIGMAIKDGVVQSITSAIDGTKSLQEVATNMLNRISNILLDIGMNLLLFGVTSGTGKGGGLLGGLFKAEGGSVMGGSPYIVGERGPELFVPGRSGTIVPNNQLGAGGATSVTVNVDASGSNVEGNDQGANQLGKVIGLAVQQELIKQKRPGGLLAGV